MLIAGRPITIVLNGDANECAKWLPFARNKLANLFLMSGDARRGHVWDVDGARIDVAAEGRTGQIDITSGAAMESGLVDFTLGDFVPGVGNLPWTTVTRVDGSTYQELRRFYPMRDKAGKAKTGPWGGSKLIARNVINDTDPAYANSLLYKSPGMYTGKMRMVVQALIGKGSPVLYGCNHTLTHGIYTAANGSLWVIEICATHGVLAWKLPGSKLSATQSRNDTQVVATKLGFMPSEVKTLPTANLAANLTSGKVRQLSIAANLSTPMNQTAVFPEAGWAFNEDGSRASNVALYLDGTTTMWIGTLFHVDITEDTTGPVAASLSIGETGYVYGDLVNQFKCPDYAHGKITTFPWYTRLSPHASVPTWNGPVYCYYDSNGTLVVVRSKSGTSTYIGTQNDANTSLSPDSAGGTNYAGRTNITEQGPTVDAYGLTRPACWTATSATEYINSTTDTKSGAWWSSVYDTAATLVNGDMYSRKQLVRTYTNPQQYTRRCIVAPLFDRQSLFSWDRVETTKIYSSTSTQTVNYYRGTVVGEGNSLSIPSTYFWDQSFLGYPAPGTVIGWTLGVPAYMIYGLTAQTAPAPPYTPAYDMTVHSTPGTGASGPTSDGTPGTSNSSLPALSVYPPSGSSAQVNAAPAYDFTVDNSLNTHYIELVADCFSANYFCSSDMDDTTGTTMYNSGAPAAALADMPANYKPRLFAGAP
jgi:hypothetical protein